MATRGTIAAITLALIATSATAAADGGGSATTAAPRQMLTPRADHPRYVEGGWVCPPGFVWRNAGKTDWLCVDPAEARRILFENERAPLGWVPAGDGTYGCRTGLVPRNAFNGDRVCVDPSRRVLVHQMNLALYIVR